MASKVVKTLESFEDFMGNIVKVGDFVVYATASYKSPVQKLAVVDNIAEVVSDTWTHNHRPGQHFTRVGVREISNGRNFSRWDKKNGKLRTTYPMTENMVLVRTKEEGLDG
jgi:hypothetical protein